LASGLDAILENILPMLMVRPASIGGAIGQLPLPRNMQKRMYSNIILPSPPKRSVGCGPAHGFDHFFSNQNHKKYVSSLAAVCNQGLAVPRPDNRNAWENYDV